MSRPLAGWWARRTVTFRRVCRTAVLLLVTGALSVVLGVTTASADSPVGPHQARWQVTLSSQVALDLGPLGTAWVPSPVAPLGVRVRIGEIPGDGDSTGSASQSGAGEPAETAGEPAPGAEPGEEASPRAGEGAVSGLTDLTDLSGLAQRLSADGAAYLALVSHPQITIEAGLRALALDAARRAGLVWSLLLCLVALGRLATGGHLRDAVALALGHGWTSALAAATVAALAVVTVAPAVRTASAPGQTLPALRGTPLEQAHWSGRLGEVAVEVSGRVRQAVEDSEAFYGRARANLEAAWQESSRLEGLVDVTVSDPAGLSSRDRHALAFQAALARAQAADQRAQALAAPAGGLAAGGARSLTGALTGPLAAAQEGRTTAVLTTDLHCNLDVIALVGRLDALAGADLHLDDGDLTMTGSQPEQVCVDALTRAVPDGVARVSSIGNHDSATTAAQLRARGWEVTDGAVVRAAGLRVLGDVDPDRTPVGGTVRRGEESVEELGQRLAEVSCTPRGRADVVLVHQPYTFPALTEGGCAPLLLAGHTHAEGGMTTTQGGQGVVSTLRSGAGLGGTSIGPVRQDAFVHVLSFDAAARLVAWRAVVLHPDASVTVSAWRQVPPVGQTAGAVEDGEG